MMVIRITPAPIPRIIRTIPIRVVISPRIIRTIVVRRVTPRPTVVPTVPTIPRHIRCGKRADESGRCTDIDINVVSIIQLLQAVVTRKHHYRRVVEALKAFGVLKHVGVDRRHAVGGHTVANGIDATSAVILINVTQARIVGFIHRLVEIHRFVGIYVCIGSGFHLYRLLFFRSIVIDVVIIIVLSESRAYSQDTHCYKKILPFHSFLF